MVRKAKPQERTQEKPAVERVPADELNFGGDYNACPECEHVYLSWFPTISKCENKSIPPKDLTTGKLRDTREVRGSELVCPYYSAKPTGIIVFDGPPARPWWRFW